jgi:hypothetical protein
LVRQELKKIASRIEIQTLRDNVISVIEKLEVCTARELKMSLAENGFGVSAIRRSYRLLNSGASKSIGVLKCVDGNKMVQFPKQGKVYYLKTIAEKELSSKIYSLLTSLQKKILQMLSKHNKRVYYFSLYELRKLLPYAGSSVDYAIKRLTSLGLTKIIEMNGTKFCCEPTNAKRLKSHKDEVIAEDKKEFLAINRVHELIMNLFPIDTIEDLRGAVRPSARDSEVVKLACGMTFDIFYKFKEPLQGKDFFAIDVYARIPVTGFVINSFLKKIEWAKNTVRTKTTFGLRDRTYGMIIFKNATLKAIEIANSNGISFKRLSKIIDQPFKDKELSGGG